MKITDKQYEIIKASLWIVLLAIQITTAVLWERVATEAKLYAEEARELKLQ